METAPDVAAAADENLAIHFTWVQRQTSGMRALLEKDLVRTECGMDCDTFNAVCRARLPAEGSAERIREAIAWFAGRPFSWWVGPADAPRDLGRRLADAGLSAAETELAMAARLSALRAAEIPDGLDIRRVATRRGLSDFARIEAANWWPPDEDVVRFYEIAAPLLLTPGSPIRLYVGYVAGEAVAASELTVGGGVAGLYGISTLESHRRRGYGTALALRPLRDARAEGLELAVLQASDAGAGVYRRIGFEEFGGITEYKPASQEGDEPWRS
jgi:ribosomal protein S18 acetylase RimI-like enzyme